MEALGGSFVHVLHVLEALAGSFVRTLRVWEGRGGAKFPGLKGKCGSPS